MPIYDCGNPECNECEYAFGPNRTKAIAAFHSRERRYSPHTHVAGTTHGRDIDECAFCGLDLRNQIHQTVTGSPAPGDDGWRPIETAPRDGTRLLLWDAKNELAVSGLWYFHPGSNDPSNGTEPPWAWWVSDGDLIMWDGGPDDKPTHWRPLPAPPSNQGEKEHAYPVDTYSTFL